MHSWERVRKPVGCPDGGKPRQSCESWFAPCLLGQDYFVEKPDSRIRGWVEFSFMDELIESWR